MTTGIAQRVPCELFRPAQGGGFEIDTEATVAYDAAQECRIVQATVTTVHPDGRIETHPAGAPEVACFRPQP